MTSRTRLATLCEADVIIAQVKPERFKDLDRLLALHREGVICLGPASLTLAQEEHPPASWGDESGRIVRFRLTESLQYIAVEETLRSLACGYELKLYEHHPDGYLENFDPLPLPPVGPQRAAWLRRALSGLSPVRGHHA